MTRVTRAYRSTLTSLDILLNALDRLEQQGKLPESEDLDSAITGAAIAVGLGCHHFDDLRAEIEKRSAKVVPMRRNA
ncbi:MAG: hypothetical protein HC841_00150 [Verrucomicrobiae bacterium]|nr:hypothetical protein [Verrucomicrobiae bacterium]